MKHPAVEISGFFHRKLQIVCSVEEFESIDAER